jgi:hypothetical protein
MTDDELSATLMDRRARLALAIAHQREELRARQQAGTQTVGPWVPVPRPAWVMPVPSRARREAVAQTPRKNRKAAVSAGRVVAWRRA